MGIHFFISNVVCLFVCLIILLGKIVSVVVLCLVFGGHSHSQCDFSWRFFIGHDQATSLLWSWLLFQLKHQVVSDISLDLEVGINWVWQNTGSKIFHPQSSPCSCVIPSFLWTPKTSEMRSGCLWHFYQSITGRALFLTQLYIAGRTKRMPPAILYHVPVSIALGLSCVPLVDCCSFVKRMERCHFLPRAEMSHRDLQGNLWRWTPFPAATSAVRKRKKKSTTDKQMMCCSHWSPLNFLALASCSPIESLHLPTALFLDSKRWEVEHAGDCLCAQCAAW